MKKFKDKIKNLSLFDILLISSIILGATIFAYIFFRKASYIKITIKVSEDSIVYGPNLGTRTWFSQMFYQGMKEKDGLGGITAEVTEIRSYDTSPTHKDIYLFFKLKTVYNRASNQYTYKGKPVLVGSTIRLYLERLLVDGLVTYVEGIKDPRENKTLIVEAQVREETPVFSETAGVREYIATAIQAGDEIRDNQGNTIVKILEKRVEDAKKTVVTADGRVLLGTDPMRKDIYLKLQIQAIKIQDRYFLFDDVPLLIGVGVPINSPNYSIYPEITKFLKLD